MNYRMTSLKYLMSTGVCTTAELIAFKKENPPEEYAKLIQATKAQAKNLNIVLEDA
jgi:hypothetical protein